MRLKLGSLFLALMLAGQNGFTADRTPLIQAAADGNKASVEKLLAQKAALDTRDSEGQTALYYALANEHNAVAKLLIQKGADLDKVGSDGESALSVATSVNNLDMMTLVIKTKPALLNMADNDGVTPLMVAAKYGAKATAELLLKLGADTKAKNKLGQTALQIAQESQNHDVAKILISKK